MKSVPRRKLFWIIITGVFVFVLVPLVGVALSKTTICVKCVRAVYKSGLELHEEPAGTVLADPSVCLPKEEGAKQYDYPGRLVLTVDKANTRMSAQILDQKIADYGNSITLLDRNISLLAGTIQRLKTLSGASAYILPIGANVPKLYEGATFEGKCYKAPGAESFGHPDALGELKARFRAVIIYAESSEAIDKALKEELPQQLAAFAALEKRPAPTKKAKKEKEELFAALTKETMAQANDFMAVDFVTAAEIMPREFGNRGTRINTTPTVSSVKTEGDCTFSTPFAITVNGVSVSHTFQKCIPEWVAIKMMKSQLEKKIELLQKAREKYAKLFAETGKERKALEAGKPEYSGD